MSAHAKRRARTRRRAAAVGTFLWAAIGRALGQPRPPWALTAAEFDDVLREARLGHNKASARPDKPKNSNETAIALLRKHRPDDFTGRFTLSRARDTKEWLERRGIYKSIDAVTKLVNRAKHRK